MKKIIIFLGPPGSGKGTQAQLLSEKFGYYHISTGELLRKLLEKKDQFSQEEVDEAEKINKGAMVADWLVYKLIFAEILKEISNNKGVVLDGAIRRISQSQKFLLFFQEQNLLNDVAIIWLRLSEEESWRRLSYRRVCSLCGLNIPFNEETQEWLKCPKCGGGLKKRFDDKSEELFKARIAEQGENALLPIVEEFKKINPNLIKEVDGTASIEEVFKEIEKKLND